VVNSHLRFARNLIFNRKYKITKSATSPSGETEIQSARKQRKIFDRLKLAKIKAQYLKSMKNKFPTNIFLEKYVYIDCFLAFAFIIISLIAPREYNQIISGFFIVITLPLLFFKIKSELNYDKENGTNLAKKTITNMILIFGLLITFYFVV
jgi:hypothetical protein